MRLLRVKLMVKDARTGCRIDDHRLTEVVEEAGAVWEHRGLLVDRRAGPDGCQHIPLRRGNRA